jgi:hypothetical protein
MAILDRYKLHTVSTTLLKASSIPINSTSNDKSRRGIKVTTAR